MRPMRYAPDGPFAGDPAGGGPVEQGAGTPGVIYRAEPSADLALTAAPELVTWQRLVGTTQTLPWLLARNRFWEFIMQLTIGEAVAVPGGNLVVECSAVDVDTAVRSALWTKTVAVPPDQTEWPLVLFDLVDATGWTADRNDVQVTVDGAATLTLLGVPTGLSASQYVP